MVVVAALVAFRKSPNILLGWRRGGDGMDSHSFLLLGWVLNGLAFIFVPKFPLVVTSF